MEKEFKKIVKNNRPKECLGKSFLPNLECNELINAHSIQNNSILKFIAGSSQTILHRRLDINESHTCELISFEKLGRNVATTFKNGMCGKHDKELFKCIEDADIDTKNKKQLLVFAIRSLLKEIYTKKHIKGVAADILKEKVLHPYLIGYNQANNILESTKKIFSKIYIQDKREFKDLETNVFILDGSYKIACSSVVSPWHGFNGEEINSSDAMVNNQNLLYINVFPSNGQTYILLSFLKKESHFFNKIIKYLKSQSSDNLKKSLSAFLLCYCQNIIITSKILEDKNLVKEVNKITSETQLPYPLDIMNSNYLLDISMREINLFSTITISVTS